MLFADMTIPANMPQPNRFGLEAAGRPINFG